MRWGTCLFGDLSKVLSLDAHRAKREHIFTNKTFDKTSAEFDLQREKGERIVSAVS
jgi:hypothetical protein